MAVGCCVLTVSDSRGLDSDESGGLIEGLVVEAGHVVCARLIVPDEVVVIRDVVAEWAEVADCRCVLITGGTGVARRDVTVEAVEGLFDKRLEGFGELFRMRSFEQIGPAAMLSRATAGVVGDTAVFLMPGSTGAVRLAMT